MKIIVNGAELELGAQTLPGAALVGRAVDAAVADIDVNVSAAMPTARNSRLIARPTDASSSTTTTNGLPVPIMNSPVTGNAHSAAAKWRSKR